MASTKISVKTKIERKPLARELYDIRHVLLYCYLGRCSHLSWG